NSLSCVFARYQRVHQLVVVASRNNDGEEWGWQSAACAAALLQLCCCECFWEGSGGREGQGEGLVADQRWRLLPRFREGYWPRRRIWWGWTRWWEWAWWRRGLGRWWTWWW
ncbi:unnamed protein product, partial [Musa acuminata subsp. burmannicoides]